MSTFDVCADFGFIEETEVYGIVPDYSYGCEVFCNTFIEVAQSIVPVDTGYLRSTLTAYYFDTTCTAETECEYAQYVEYGTWKQAAQPYFEPALEEALNAAAPLWREAEQEAQDEEQQLIELEQMEQQEAMGMGGGAGLAGFSLTNIFAFFLTIFVVAVINFAFSLIGSNSNYGGGSSGGGRGGGFRGSGFGGGGVYLPEVIII